MIIYDTDWTSKEKEENIIKELQDKCDEKESLTIYDMITKDTLEEELIDLNRSDLNTTELKSLIQYKANKILAMDKEGTLDFSMNIEDVINNGIISTSERDENVAPPKKYTIKDILEHPENQGVIRVFAGFFIAMIVIPIGLSIYLNSKVMPYILQDWSKEGKQNIVIGIGAAVAHLIGIIYICYSWSGEDAEPDHIRDAREEEEKKTIEEEEYETESESESEDEDTNKNTKDQEHKPVPKALEESEDDTAKTSPSSSAEDKKEYLFIEREERESTGKDIIDNKGGQNELRNRKKGSK